MTRCLVTLLLGISLRGFAADDSVRELLDRIDALQIDFTNESAPPKLLMNEILTRVKLLKQGESSIRDVKSVLGRAHYIKDGVERTVYAPIWVFSDGFCYLELWFKDDVFSGAVYHEYRKSPF